MQDRYAGDIGDFGKFALLNELSKQGLSIGINWYKTKPHKSERNEDGRYTQIPTQLRDCNPILADKLSMIAKSENRSIQAIEKTKLIPRAVYYGETVSLDNRLEWHEQAISFFKKSDIDLVFLDPDNGLLVPSVKKHQPRSIKYCFYEEVEGYIKQGFSVLIYNHRSRKPELKYFQEIESKLRTHLPTSSVKIFEITFPRYSVRDYFAIPAKSDHSDKINAAFSTMLSGKWVETHMCQKPLSMGATYSEYRARFSSTKSFLRHYKALPEEIVLQMIKNDTTNSTSITVNASKYSAWKTSR